MFDSTQGHLAKGRFLHSLSGLFNPFLLFFALILAGIPLSYFAEMINDPDTRKMSYWIRVNADTHLPYAAIKSDRQRSGWWSDRGITFPDSRSYYSKLATAKLPRTDSLPHHYRQTLPIFTERP